MVAFEIDGQRLALELPPVDRACAVPSVFLIGMPKAGSTLLNRIMQPLCGAAGLTWYAPQERLRHLGVKPADYPTTVDGLYRPVGYAYGGYRSMPGAMGVPSFASDRTILLVRDPRDMLTSLYFSLAISHAPPGTAAGAEMERDFHRRREEIARSSIDDFVLKSVRTTLGQFNQIARKLTGIDHRTYRYEDVIFEKTVWVDDMLGYLGLDVTSDVVAEAIARNDVRPVSEDSRQHIRRVAPGDHRDKLSPATIEQLNQELRPVLDRFGYS